MILTPIARDQLIPSLDRFAAGLHDPLARALFAEIRSTSPDRAEGKEAERHCVAAVEFAKRCGVPVHPFDTACEFNWDGVALNPATEAYVILHEVAHFLLAPPERRKLVDFGLGPGPDTIDRTAAERAACVPVLEREADEALASLAGIVWEARLGQPALASFLDQNWLEGGARAPAHFAAVAARLSKRGLLALDSHHPNRHSRESGNPGDAAPAFALGPRLRGGDE
jgi:hypothetical protein